MHHKLTKTLNIIGITAAMALLSCSAVFAEGWTTNSSGQQTYQNADGTTVKNVWIKTNNNGGITWYYTTNDGAIKTDGWLKVNNKSYYFDDSGVMQTGWVDNYTYYCDESGAMVTGWKKLTIPDDFSYSDESYTSGDTGWFYFAQNNGKKYASDSDNVVIKKIDGHSYGFDSNGIMVTGWAKTEDSNPELAGYCYFVEKNDGNLKLGQRVEKTWYTTTGPTDDDGNTDESLATGDIEYYYFKADGHPVVGGTDVCRVERINGKIYLFNKYGNPATGLQYGAKNIDTTITDADVYHCGESKTSSSAETNKKIGIVDDGGESVTLQLLANGKGVTGQKGGYLYYQGKLQKAESGSRYMTCIIDGDEIVVNQSGSIMKNKTKIKDTNGNIMSTDSLGRPTAIDGAFETFTAEGPEIDTDSDV